MSETLTKTHWKASLVCLEQSFQLLDLQQLLRYDNLRRDDLSVLWVVAPPRMMNIANNLGIPRQEPGNEVCKHVHSSWFVTCSRQDAILSYG